MKQYIILILFVAMTTAIVIALIDLFNQTKKRK